MASNPIPSFILIHQLSRIALGAAYWVAPNGFWMWGGEGFDSVSGGGDHLLSDLWRYLPFP